MLPVRLDLLARLARLDLLVLLVLTARLDLLARPA